MRSRQKSAHDDSRNVRYKDAADPKAGSSQSSESSKGELLQLLNSSIMVVSVIALAFLLPMGLGLFSRGVRAQFSAPAVRPLPKAAQIIDQRVFNVLENVPPPSQANGTTVWFCA